MPLTFRPTTHALVALLTGGMALLGATASGTSGGVNTDYVTPDFTFSPGGRYGVMVPVFHFDAAMAPDDRMNKVVELSTRRVVAVIDASPGYNRPLNFHETTPPRWSADASLLLWKIEGKWSPDALVLLKIEGNRATWQLDLLKTAQQTVLRRTRQAAPKRYLLAKKANAGNGSAFPDGFTVFVTTDGEDGKTVSLPLMIHADLVANLKNNDRVPNLDSHLDAVVTPAGKFVVKSFRLVPHQTSDEDPQAQPSAPGNPAVPL